MDIQAYSKMGVGELKKLLEERKIDGRSKVTKKDAMIKVLELFDQDPEDKKAIKALIAELATPKKTTSSSKSKGEEGPEAKVEIKEPETKEPQTSEKPVKEKKKPSSKPSSEEKVTVAEKPTEKAEKKVITKKVKDDEEEQPIKKVQDKKTLSIEKVKVKSVKQDDKELDDKQKQPEPKVEINEKKVDEEKEPGPEQEKVKEPEHEEKEEQKQQAQTQQEQKPSEEKLEPTEDKTNSSQDESTPKSRSVEDDSPIVDAETIKNDEDMKEIFKLSRDILKRLKVFAREAASDDEFKEVWIKDLKKMKKKMDYELGMMGAYDEELLGEQEM